MDLNLLREVKTGGLVSNQQQISFSLYYLVHLNFTRGFEGFVVVFCLFDLEVMYKSYIHA